MNEELKNKLTERFDKITAGECDNKDLRDALLKAYIAGGEYGYNYALQHPHWIPVEERLPKFDEQVLVYGLCPNGCRLFYVDCLIQDINDNGYPKWDDDTIIPTHWMPIVPPRKEVTND